MTLSENSVVPSDGWQASAAPASSLPDVLSMRQIIDVVSSRWRLILLLFILVFGIGGTYALVATPIYQADSLIQIEEKKGTTLSGLQEIATALDVSQSPVAGELEIIRSRDVIGAAIATLGLDVRVQTKRRVPIYSSIYAKLQHDKSKVATPPLGLDSYAWGGENLKVAAFELPDDAARAVTYTLRAAGNEHWILLNADGQQIATGVAGAATSFQMASGPGRLFVTLLIARAGEEFTLRKLSLASAYAEAIGKTHVVESGRQSSVIRLTYEDRDPVGVVAFVNEVAKNYLRQNVDRRSEEAAKSLAFLDERLPQLQKDVENAEQAFNAYRLSRHSVDLDKESQALLNEAVELEKQRLEADMKRQELLQRFQPDHPELKTLSSQVADLSAEGDKLNAQITKLPETQQEFFRLQRDVKVSTDLYIALLNNAQQLRIAKAGTIGNVRIIDYATLPDGPSRPRVSQILSISAVLGLVLGVAATFIARAFRPSIGSVEEAEAAAGVPIYATIPYSRSQPALLNIRRSDKRPPRPTLLFQASPGDPAIEALRSMRMGLQFGMVDAKNNLIAITGATPEVGKTFVSCNLAAVLASGNARVLLIDADMRRPRIDRYFNLQRSPGLADFLSKRASFDEVVHHIAELQLDIICAGTIPPNPAELLLNPQMSDMIAEAGRRYDLVVVDTPPLLPVSDTLTISKIAGSVFLVVRAEVSTTDHVIESRRRLLSAGGHLNGVVFNGIQTNRLNSRYRYQYYYARYAD